MKKREATIAARLLCLVLCLCGPGQAQDEATDMDEVLFGAQICGAPISEEDCEGRVSVLFVWGIT